MADNFPQPASGSISLDGPADAAGRNQSDPGRFGRLPGEVTDPEELPLSCAAFFANEGEFRPRGEPGCFGKLQPA